MVQVKITDYGFEDDLKRYYVTYQVTGLDEEELDKLKERLEDPVVVKCDEISLNVYFEAEYYPFHTEESQKRLEDFIAREEIEMTAYLVDLLEED
jgi:hypothetical protein